MIKLKDMKKLILLLVLVSIFNSIHAQVPSNCTVPPLLANKYSRDISQLATRRMFQLQNPDTALVGIPQEYIDTISEGLAAIFNAASIPERDSVFNLYCVHNYNGGYLGDPYANAYVGLLVKVDTSYSWTQSWQNLNTITGNPFMDTILTRYNLTITNFYNWTIGNYAELSLDSFPSWNIFALMDSIEMTAGVIYTEANNIFAAAGYISYNTIGNTRYYNFYFEFADCFDGCDNYRMWSFKVNPDCSVEYLGFVNWSVWNPPLHPFPPPVNCNTFTSVAENNIQKVNCLIFPNPTSGKLTLEIKNNETGEIEFYNVFGKKIYSEQVSSGRAKIDLSNHPNGIYFLNIKTEKESFTQKIIIQK